MDLNKLEERAFGRFEKVLRFYWDGVPVPPFVCAERGAEQRTFVIRRLGYSADYYGETVSVSLSEQYPIPNDFSPLCCWGGPTSSMSSRIGAHYSPLVGTFCFHETSGKTKKARPPPDEGSGTLRIPKEACETNNDFDDEVSWRTRRYLRMGKMVDLFLPLVKEFTSLRRESLRRIVVLATKGQRLQSKEWVVREVAVVQEEYSRNMGNAIYYYMCRSRAFRRITEPLQLNDQPDPDTFRIDSKPFSTRAESRQHFTAAKQALESSLGWGRGTRPFFVALETYWQSHFADLVMFDLPRSGQEMDTGVFVNQISTSMRSAFARIRIEFYAYVEECFFSHIKGARETLRMTEAEVRSSSFQRVFTATRIFLFIHIRSVVFDNLERLETFLCGHGTKSHRAFRRDRSKSAVIHLDVVVGDNSQPRTPAFTRLLLGLSDLMNEVSSYANSLPSVESVLLRTLDLKPIPVPAVTPVEVALFRSSFVEVLDRVGTLIAKTNEELTPFVSIPTQLLSIARGESLENAMKAILSLREGIRSIRRACPDRLFFGPFTVNYVAIKQQFVTNWEEFLERFLDEFFSSTMKVITVADEKCNRVTSILGKRPTTVDELERFLRSEEEALSLAAALRGNECQKLLVAISTMEENHVSVDEKLFSGAVRLMKWPGTLEDAVTSGSLLKKQSKPLLLEELGRIRHKVRENIRMMSIGVTELYNMFNLEICDIAAQTCQELRELVDHVTKSIELIFQHESVLGVATVDSFADFFPLLNWFETLEQYWTAIYKSTDVRKFYASPVAGLNAHAMIESVREWRRLIHASARQLRGFEALVRLGRHQEAALAEFEALEDLLALIASPSLRKSHWKQIATFLAPKMGEDTSLVVNMNVSLQRLLDAGIMGFMEDLKRIVAQAKADFEAEDALEAMRSLAKRQRFAFTKKCEGVEVQNVLSTESYTTLLELAETFIQRSRVLREKAGISGVVLSALCEWEAASGRAREYLLAVPQLEERWGELCQYYGSLRTVVGEGCDPLLQHIFDKLAVVAETFNSLHTAMKKPQFSFYVSIVQDTVTESLLSIKTGMGEATLLMAETLEARRTAFPRFRFLTDAQLLKFNSAFSVTILANLLPSMYACLHSLRIEENVVVAFLTADGATLNAVNPVPLTAEPVEVWMKRLDDTIASSLSAAVLNTMATASQSSLQSWLLGTCSQVANVVLRATHTRNMRDALQLGGTVALRAYQHQLQQVHEELDFLERVAETPKHEREKVSSALLYVQLAEDDVRLALESGVTSPADLDATPMLQTVVTATGVVTRTLGVSFPYGLEFLGDYPSPIMSQSLMCQAVTALLLSEAGRFFPLVSGGAVVEAALDFIALYLGRHIVRLQCHNRLPADLFSSYLHGAMETGAVLCLQNCEALPAGLQDVLTTCLSIVYTQSTSSPSTSATLQLPLGLGGANTAVTVHPTFSTLLLTHQYAAVGQRLRLQYRPVFLSQIPTEELIRDFFLAHAVQMPPGGQIEAFAMVFSQLQCLRPHTFTEATLRLLVNIAAELHDDSVIARLCTAFTTLFGPAMATDPPLRQLFQWHARYTLREAAVSSNAEGLGQGRKDASGCGVVGAAMDLLTVFQDDKAPHHPHVLVVGPPFSGKTTLWKGWVEAGSYTVFSPALITCDELYGTARQPGFLPSVLAQKPPGKSHFVVMEDDESNNAVSTVLWCSMKRQSRFCSTDANVVADHHVRVIVTARRMQYAAPPLAEAYVVVSLDAPQSWHDVLHHSLRGAPQGEIASAVMGALLPDVLAAVEEDDSVRRCSSDRDCRHLVLSHRSASLYQKWFAHVQESVAPLLLDSDDTPLDEKLFAAQCAVFAVGWGIGLSLAAESRPLLTAALRAAEKSVARAGRELGVTESVLPPLGEADEHILDLICTPRGWKKLHQANRFGFRFSWSQFTFLNSQTAAWVQVFATPTRSSTLRAVECLLMSGQSVILSGGTGTGKSTLLRTMRHSDGWVSQLTCGNAGLQSGNVQSSIAARLSQRSNHRFGPPLGRKLVVCIDDMHLAPGPSSDLSTAARLVAFCEKYSGICTTARGFLPVSDVAFCSAAPPRQQHDSVMRACVEVLLPSLDKGDVVNGVWKLFEVACAKKRAEGLPCACASFLTVAHSCFVRQLQESAAATSVAVGQASPPQVGSDQSPLSNPAVREALGCVTERFHDFQRAVDATRKNLLGAVSDLQVALNVFGSVGTVYSLILQREGSEEKVDVFQRALETVAEETLGRPFRDEVSFEEVAGRLSQKHNANATLVTEHAKLVSWVDDYHVSLHEMSEEDLETLDVSATVALPKKGARRLHAVESFADGTTSVLITFPFGGASGAGVTTPTSRRISRSGSLAPSRRVSSTVLSNRHSIALNTANAVSRLTSQTLARLPRTTWLAHTTTSLVRAIQLFESHVALVGHVENDFHQVLRIAGCTTRVPIADFCSARPVVYTFDTFAAEMRSVISFACFNMVRVVVFIPDATLRVNGVPPLLDVMIRSGDVSQLFDGDERQALQTGMRVAKKASLAAQARQDDEPDLRRKIRNNVLFLVQVNEESYLQELVRGYPPFGQMDVHSLHDANKIREIVQEVLDDCDDDGEGEEDGLPRPEPLSDAVCRVFEHVSRKVPTCIEQLVEFASQLNYLYSVQLDKVRFAATAGHTIKSSGNSAAAELHLAGQRLKQFPSELSAARAKLADLRDRLSAECRERQKRAEAAERGRQALKEEESTLLQREAAIERRESEAVRGLSCAVTALVASKLSHIRAMSSARPPPKGSLLVRGVYCVLGQAVPTVKDGAAGLWAKGVELMCAAGFSQRLAALSVDAVGEIAPEVPALRQNLSEARFDGTLPYAQRIADFVVAFLGCVILRLDVIKPEREGLMRDKQAHEERLKWGRRLETEAEIGATRVAVAESAIREEEEHIVRLQKEQQDLIAREKHLARYVGLVDQMAQLITPTDEAVSVERLRFAKGDAVLLTALYSLCAAHPGFEETSHELRALLEEMHYATSPMPDCQVASLLFPGYGSYVEHYLPSFLPANYRIAAFFQFGRIPCRWPLFGGSSPIIDNVLHESLRHQCTGSVMLSATDPNVKKDLVAAMGKGQGVLLSNVFELSSLVLAHQLSGLTEELAAEMRKDRGVEKKALPFRVFGQEVDVHPQFFLVCTSPISIPPDEPAFSFALAWFNVVNLLNSIPRASRYETLLQRLPCNKNALDESLVKREQYYEETQSFMRSHEAACRLIASDFSAKHRDSLTENLQQLDDAISDAETHRIQLMQLINLFQVMRRAQVEVWGPVVEGMCRVADLVSFVEAKKLGRPWDERCLDVFASRIATLSTELVKRISPSSFGDLPAPLKRFYGLVNFMEVVVQCYACGWPAPLRGTFALFLVMTCVVEGKDTFVSHRGVLFSRSVEFLTAAQVKILAAMMESNLTATPVSQYVGSAEQTQQRQRIRKLYSASGDATLMRLASTDGAAGGSLESRVGQLFHAFLCLDVTRVEQISRELYTAFFHSVKDSTTVLGPSANGNPRGESAPPLLAVHGLESQESAIHSYESLVQCSFTNFIPVEVQTESPYNTLQWVWQRAEVMQYVPHAYFIESGQDVYQLAKDVERFLHHRPEKKKGHWCIAHVEVTVPQSERAALELLGAMRRLLALLYCHRGQAADGRPAGVPVVIWFVCSVSLMMIIRPLGIVGSIDFATMFVDRDFGTPRQWLVELLEFVDTHSLHRLDTASAKKDVKAAHGKRDDEDESTPTDHTSPRALDVKTALFLQEVSVVYAGMRQRDRHLQEWLGSTKWPRQTMAPTVTAASVEVVLRLLRTWLQPRRELVVSALRGAAEAEHRERGEAAASAASHAKGGQQLSGPSAQQSGGSKGKDAVLYYRERCRGWRQYKQTAANYADPLRYIAAIISEEGTGDVSGPSWESATEKLTRDAELLEAYFIRVLFPTMRKLTALVFAAGIDGSVFTQEHAAVRWMVEEMLVVPPGSSRTVDCRIASITPPCPLQLVEDTDIAEFTEEVAKCPSTLEELSGDPYLAPAFHETATSRVCSVLFGTAVGPRVGKTGLQSVAPAAASEGVVGPVKDGEEQCSTEANGDSMLCDAADIADVVWHLESAHLRALVEQCQRNASTARTTADSALDRVEATLNCLCEREKGMRGGSGGFSGLSVWVPALRYPAVTLYLLCRAAAESSCAAAASSDATRVRVADDRSGAVSGQVILLLLRRRFVTLADVVLEGVHPSPPLWSEVQARTGWVTRQDGSKPMTQADSSDDVVVAARFVETATTSVRERSSEREANLRYAPRTHSQSAITAGVGVQWRAEVGRGAAFLWDISSSPASAAETDERDRGDRPPPEGRVGSASTHGTRTEKENVFVTSVDVADAGGPSPIHRDRTVCVVDSSVPLALAIKRSYPYTGYNVTHVLERGNLIATTNRNSTGDLVTDRLLTHPPLWERIGWYPVRLVYEKPDGTAGAGRLVEEPFPSAGAIGSYLVAGWGDDDR